MTPPVSADQQTERVARWLAHRGIDRTSGYTGFDNLTPRGQTYWLAEAAELLRVAAVGPGQAEDAVARVRELADEWERVAELEGFPVPEDAAVGSPTRLRAALDGDATTGGTA